MPIAEDVMGVDEEADESVGVKQEKKVTVEDVMEKDEVVEGKRGVGRAVSSVLVTAVAGGLELETPLVENTGGGFNGTHKN